MKIFRNILAILIWISAIVYLCKFALYDDILDGVKAILFVLIYYGNEITTGLNKKE